MSVRNETRQKVLFDQLNDFAIYGYRRVATGMRLDFTISEKESFLPLRPMKKLLTYVALHRTCKVFSQPDTPTRFRLSSIVKSNEFLYLSCFTKFLLLNAPSKWIGKNMINCWYMESCEIFRRLVRFLGRIFLRLIIEASPFFDKPTN